MKCIHICICMYRIRIHVLISPPIPVPMIGQLRHVMDERKLLSLMNSRFVLKLRGTYQTPHQLVMVTEALDCGDLWSIIYETYPFNVRLFS
jgi:hypothetical protein